MQKTIYYSEKKTTATTVYARINQNEKLMMLDNLALGLYRFLEETNLDAQAKSLLHVQDNALRKHLASTKNANNSTASFLGGLLAQHYNKPDKDISTKMLRGIELVSQLLNAFDKTCPIYRFEIKKTESQPTLMDALFEQ